MHFYRDPSALYCPSRCLGGPVSLSCSQLPTRLTQPKPLAAVQAQRQATCFCLSGIFPTTPGTLKTSCPLQGAVCLPYLRFCRFLQDNICLPITLIMPLGSSREALEGLAAGFKCYLSNLLRDTIVYKFDEGMCSDRVRNGVEV